MPIYAYRCAACGHAQDVLQKMSDAVLTQCPACGAQAYQKQVTAAGFQLKGSGWYVTDFRGGNTQKKDAAEGGDAKPADTKPAEGAPAGAEAKTEGKPAEKAEKAADKAAAPAAAPPSAPTPTPGS